MQNDLYLKGPGILVQVSTGLTLFSMDGIKGSQAAKVGQVPSDFGGTLATFNAGNEHTYTCTPTGIVSAAMIGLLFPFVNKAIGSKVFTDDVWKLYGQDGRCRTLYNAAITVQPTVDIGVDKPGYWGQITLKALHAKTGANAGQLFSDAAASFPDFSFINLAGIVRAAPSLSWFADRTTGLVAASSTLTSDATNPGDGGNVVVGSVTYRMKTTPAAAYDVKIGVDAATTLANLKKAINTTGTPGTEYFAGTLIHPTVVAGTITSTTLLVTAKLAGSAGNSIATTDTATHLSWTGATLAGGVDPYANTNAVGYVAGPADPGWYTLNTSVGVKLNPKQTLKLEPSAQYGGFGNYTLTDTGCEAQFVPVNLTENAFDAAANQTVGSSLDKGDLVITAGSLTAVVAKCSFNGGSKEWHAANLRLSQVTLMSTLAFQGGQQINQLSLSYSG